MNITRRRLGQFDPSTGIMGDIAFGPQDTTTTDTFPMYYDPGLIAAEQGIGPATLTPTVPQPPSAPSTSPVYATFGPYGTTVPSLQTATAPPVAPGAISPAPKVNIPTSTFPGLMAASFAGIPMVAWLGIGILAVVAVSGAGGRRRR